MDKHAHIGKTLNSLSFLLQFHRVENPEKKKKL